MSTGIASMARDPGEASTVPSEAPRRPWAIAWCHTGDSGGSKRAAFEMVRELARRGHIIDEYIVRVGEPNCAHWPLQPFVRQSFHHVLPSINNRLRPHLVHAWVRLAQDLWRRRALTATLRAVSTDLASRRYDLIHIDHCSPSYTVMLTAMVSLPTVVYCHEVSGARYRIPTRAGAQPWALRRGYEYACELASRIWADVTERGDLQGLSHARLILTNSCYSKETLFLRARRTGAVCPYGVDAEVFRPLGLPREALILSAGRLVAAKQHHLVIEAVARIPSTRRPRVVIATPETMTHQEDPAYTQLVMKMANASQVALDIRRNPTEHELVGLYNRALMLVFVPIMEPFGLVALEAMACGTPVVGIREGGVRESVRDGRVGVLIDRSPTELSKAIEHLLEHEEMRNRFGAEATAYVRKEWTWMRSIDRYESEVARVLDAVDDPRR